MHCDLQRDITGEVDVREWHDTLTYWCLRTAVGFQEEYVGS